MSMYLISKSDGDFSVAKWQRLLPQEEMAFPLLNLERPVENELVCLL